MASPSIGDVLEIIKIVYGVYKKCKDAPEAINDAMDDVKHMRIELQSMQQKANDPKSFIYKNQGKMLAQVKGTFVPLIESLESMQELINEYRQTLPASMDWVFFVTYKMRYIKDIRAAFAKAREDYAIVFQHIGQDAHDSHASQLREIAAREASLKKDVAAMKKEQRDSHAQVVELIKSLKAGFQPTASTDVTLPQRRETQLRAAGFKDDEVKRIMAMLKFDALPPISVTPTPESKDSAAAKPATPKGRGVPVSGNDALNVVPPSKPGNSAAKTIGTAKSRENIATGVGVLGDGLNVPHRRRASSQPRNPSLKSSSPGSEPPNKRAPSPSPPSTKVPSPTPSIRSISAPKSPAKNKNVRVLCVDHTHGFRSIQAHAYLCLIRLWTANTSSSLDRKWIFVAISSAGVNLSGPLTTQKTSSIQIYAAAPASIRETALNTLSGSKAYFWSDNYPFEKNGVISHVKSQEPKALVEQDFESYGYILCFGPSVYSSLVALAKTAKSKNSKAKAKVVLISGTEWFDTRKHTHPAEFEEVTANLKKGLKDWLGKELGWKRPEDNKGIVSTVDGVQERTVQMTLPWKYKKELTERRADIEEGKIKKLEGYSVHWEDITTQGNILVSVTGRREKLKEAETWVRALC